jgi:hypothetical protein
MSEPIELLGCDPRVRVVPCIKAIRRATGWGLAEAKQALTSVRAGDCITLPVASARVDQSVVELCGLGFTLRSRGEEHTGRPQPASWIEAYHCAHGTVLEQRPHAECLVLVVAVDGAVEATDQIVIEIDADYALTEVLDAVTPVPEGVVVRIAPPDPNALAFLREHFTAETPVRFVRGAPLPVREAR